VIVIRYVDNKTAVPMMTGIGYYQQLVIVVPALFLAACLLCEFIENTAQSVSFSCPAVAVATRIKLVLIELVGPAVAVRL
jgi:hypothetical protein